MKRILAILLICIVCFCDAAPAMAENDATAAGGENTQASSQQDADPEGTAGGPDGSQDAGNGTEGTQQAGDVSEDASKGVDGEGGTLEDESQQKQDENGSGETEASRKAIQAQNLPVAASGNGTLKTDMWTDELLFITLADNFSYRWNANDSAEKNSVIHLDTVAGQNCNFRLYSTGGGWYGIKHIKSGGTDRYADIEDKSTSSGAKLHLWESSDSKVSGNDHRQFAFYHVGQDHYGNDQYYIQNKNSQKWLGYEDTDGDGKPSSGDKIIQTDESNRKVWIVTRETIPKRGNEVTDLVKSGDSYVFCEMFRKGTIKSINRGNDLAADRTTIHFYQMGTSSKWRLEYNSKYQAYEIHAVTDGEADRNGKVWDVAGESGGENAQIWLWSNQSKDNNENTSQLWRFIRQSSDDDNVIYKIQNARSGKYVSYTSTDEYLVQDSKGTDIEVDLIAGSDHLVNFDYSQDWMQDIPEDAYLSSVNIPGSHDTGTASITEDFLAELSLTSCQKYYYGEQLNVGIRSFDIRCNATKDKASPSDVMIIHGSDTWQCYDRDDSKLTLEDILSDSTRFLSEHPSETLIMMVKPDDGSTEGLARAVGSFIKDNKSYVWTGDGIPSMGEARGKIVFIRRYEIDTGKYDPADDGLESDWFGIDLSGWDSHSYGDYQYAINIYDKDGVSVYAQDAYNEYSSGKWNYIEGTMKQTTGTDTTHPVPAAAWIYNYTSCAVGFPLGLTRDINPKLFGDSANCIDNRRLGMVMMNFVDRPMSRLIYATNTADSKFYATKADAPDTVALTYGQTLSQAKLSGGSTDGTWKFQQEDYIPTYEDFKNKKTFEITYTPDDTRLQPVTAEVCITDFTKKKISVTIDNKEITYGDARPELTYSFDASQLVGDDTADDLGITLTLTPDTEMPAAGEYDITGKSVSDHYAVTFTTGKLTVHRKKVGIQWSDTKNLVYTKDPVHVTATLSGVLDGDDCKAVVTGGDAVGPSWTGDPAQPPEKYTATVTELSGDDKGNYQLPDEVSIGYYIRRADPEDFMFPEKASLTYGQTLSEATLTGASGDGEFRFVDSGGNNIGDTIPDAGTEDYRMVYIPKENATVHAMQGTIPVEVQPKAITAAAKDADKTYGDATDLEFSLDESQLVSEKGDTIDKLDLVLTAGAGDAPTCDAGTYRIVKKECGNQNYDVTVIPATLTVSRLEAQLTWKGEHSYVYTGAPVALSVTVDNVVKADDCDVRVTGAAGTQVGTYTAVVTGLINKNYILPKDPDQLSWTYEIRKADPQVVFPTSAVVTYGDLLDQAELSGQSGDGTFRFEEGDKMLTVAEDGMLQRMIFTPSDSVNYNSKTQEVAVQVQARPLTITGDDQQKTYGQKTPTLTWYMDESQLVGTDSIDEFVLTLTAGTGDSETCDAGCYTIKVDQIAEQNENYQIQFEEGLLTVDPLMVVCQWNSLRNIKVGDDPPSAAIVNLVTGDDCRLTVESDGTSQASWTVNSDQVTIFEAEITGLEGVDKFNYTLPDEDLTRQYLVRRDDPDTNDYHMPTMAVLTYGQTLSDAELFLASGEGSFVFVNSRNQEIGDTMPEKAGLFSYTVKFIPDDGNIRPVEASVPVLVKPKKITAQAENTEKTYGEKTVLSFTLDETQLVGSDNKEDLQLSLTAINTEGEDGDRIKSPAGSYQIQKEACGNGSYDVTVTPAILWIHQRQTGILWSDVSDLHYTGNPVNVTATATDLLPGDTASIYVINGKRVEIGTYRAFAEGISNSNYRLVAVTKEDVEHRICPYEIRKGIPEVTFPKAVVHYGESLAAASLSESAGEGVFAFDDPAAILPVSESGKTRAMTFTPADLQHYETVTQQVPVQVIPRQVTLTWLGTETRTYDGKPSNVRAAAGNLLSGDVCDVTVKNGKKTRPGTYTARAVALSNDNYVLPEDETQLTADYVIQEATSTAAAANSENGGSDSGTGGTGARTSDPWEPYLAALALTAVLSAAAAVFVLRRNRTRR